MSQGLASGAGLRRNRNSLIPFMCLAQSCLQNAFTAAQGKPGEAGGPALGTVPV